MYQNEVLSGSTFNEEVAPALQTYPAVMMRSDQIDQTSYLGPLTPRKSYGVGECVEVESMNGVVRVTNSRANASEDPAFVFTQEEWYTFRFAVTERMAFDNRLSVVPPTWPDFETGVAEREAWTTRGDPRLSGAAFEPVAVTEDVDTASVLIATLPDGSTAMAHGRDDPSQGVVLLFTKAEYGHFTEEVYADALGITLPYTNPDHPRVLEIEERTHALVRLILS